jgi:hypothetical protein
VEDEEAEEVENIKLLDAIIKFTNAEKSAQVEQNYQMLDSFVRNSTADDATCTTDDGGGRLRELIKSIKSARRGDGGRAESVNTCDAEVQTSVSVPPTTDDASKSLEELLELNKNSDLTPIEAQLKLNLDNFVAKMTTFSERNGNALLKFAKTRSFHELVKIQRFLLVSFLLFFL